MKSKMLYILGGVLFSVLVIFFITNQNKANIKLKIQITERENEQESITEMLRWQFNRLKNPKTNSIPFDMRSRELEFAKKLNRDKIILNKSQSEYQWAQEGPINQGGRSKAIVQDINNENILLAAAAEGGIWRSENGGTNWTSVTDRSFIQNVNCITQDTRAGKTNNWYYGTGEYSSNLFIDGNGLGIFLGDGIYKSTDNGKTWNPIASTISNSPGSTTDPFQIVWDVKVDKSNTQQTKLYAACLGGIKLSTDGGETWLDALMGTGNYFQIPNYTSVSLNKNGIAFAALSSGNSSGIYLSNDGMSWNDITPNFWPAQVYRIETASSESNPDLFYILATTPLAGHPGSVDDDPDDYNSLWRYNLSTGAWENLSNKLPDFDKPVRGYSSQGGYDVFIKVKPDNENFVVIGGTNIYRTTDGFATKLDDSDWCGGYGTNNDIELYENHHPDQHGFFFAYNNSNTAFSAHDGGLSKTNDISAQNVVWQDISKGYITTQLWNIAIEHSTPNNEMMLGGFQDNGTYLDTVSFSATSWNNVDGGDGAYAAIADNNKFLYFSSQYGNIYRADLSQEWAMVTPKDAAGFLFITPYILDPNNTDIMYLAAGDKVWRNSDLSQIPSYIQEPTAKNWTAMTNVVDGNYVTALAMTKSNPNLLYIGDERGNVYKITDASNINSNFVKVSNNKFPKGYIASIAVDPSDGNNVLVGFSNYQTSSLFHSSDGGATWEDVGGNLEENSDGSGNGPSIRNVKIMPVGNSKVYLTGTSIGLFSANNLNADGTIWEQQGSQNIGNIVVETIDIRPIDGKVVVGTFGRGVFSSTINLTKANTEKIANRDYNLSQNYPNPFNPSTKIEYSIAKTSNVRLAVYNSLGEKITELVNGVINSGKHEVEFNASNMQNGTKSLASGIYLYKLSADDFSITKKMLLLK